MNNQFLNRYLITGMCACLFMYSSGCTRISGKTNGKKEKFAVTNELIKQLLVDTVKIAPQSSLITLSGKIQADESKMIKIFPLVSGIAGNVAIQQGDAVKQGQLLTTLKSPEMAGFAKDAVASQTELRNSRRALEVAQDLYKSGLTSQKDLEAAKGDYLKAKAETQRSKVVMGINKGNSKLAYELRAPISGFVIEKNVTTNMQVRTDNGQNLFTVADLSTVWAILNIYESDVSKIKTGDLVSISTISYPDKVFEGKIDKIYDILDQDNRVMRARVKIKNADFALKPGMFANVNVTGHSGDQLPFVNSRCLVFDKDRNYVLVLDKKAHVRIQEVELAKRMEDIVFINKGLNEGDRVIASRQVYLYQSLKN
ncbi:efflux RND transporter periplasmic adaptor subunit [Pedobacter riviphilus]|uniref:Efflux RND transporter periplasmic adaptor subunit n=1 Tax=Pedobacter riviphilus TaxID=2766984 RepID=A0ABX6TMY8_9SPHI|nr:efflux RND transporter periplasmic adaptor subunit [Pedobacter riviphilus]QNR86798.1 efflux RND transporter periplasmic adaptor subunit [Pedobacter riviphilus]